MIQALHSNLITSDETKADVLRLDLLHPQISGNKWFKLKYYLHHAKVKCKTGLLSFGGAYSNHLVALAFACAEQGLKSIGVVRGDEEIDNDSIRDMRRFGMQVIFATRTDYKNKKKLADRFLKEHPSFLQVPEGGSGEQGILGAAEILKLAPDEYTHIACAVGTGTTLAGLVNGSSGLHTIVGVHCVKMQSENNSVERFVKQHAHTNNYRLLSGYEFGGFAKKSDTLIRFMNDLYSQEKIPTDFIYTGKLFYALRELMRNREFPPRSKLLIIHSGGLQGNRSLKPGTLDF